jgi:hypothetical protein
MITLLIICCLVRLLPIFVSTGGRLVVVVVVGVGELADLEVGELAVVVLAVLVEEEPAHVDQQLAPLAAPASLGLWIA